MKYPNAAKGFKRIFTAEILKLISYVCLIGAVLIFVIALASSGVDDLSESDLMSVFGSAIGGVVLLLAFAILYFLWFIFNLIGYISARHDDENFKTALFFLIVSIVCSVASLVILSNGFASILYSLGTLSETLATIFVIAGGMKLANQLDRGDISKKGKTVLVLIIVVEVITFVITFITTFLRGIATSYISSVLMLVTFLLGIIKYIMYLSFLSKAKKMLREN